MTDKKDTNPKDAAASTRLDISLFPMSAICYGALGMTEGSYKYGGYNYREAGVNISIYISAAMRHLMKFYNGDWEDRTTRVPHLASALSCIAILIDGFEQNNIKDDRPPKQDMEKLLRTMQDHVSYLQEVFPNPCDRVTEV